MNEYNHHQYAHIYNQNHNNGYINNGIFSPDFPFYPPPPNPSPNYIYQCNFPPSPNYNQLPFSPPQSPVPLAPQICSPQSQIAVAPQAPSEQKQEQEQERRYEVEEVIDTKYDFTKSVWEYKVKWKGYPHTDNSWISEIDGVEELVLIYWQQRYFKKKLKSRLKKSIKKKIERNLRKLLNKHN